MVDESPCCVVTLIAILMRSLPAQYSFTCNSASVVWCERDDPAVGSFIFFFVYVLFIGTAAGTTTEADGAEPYSFFNTCRGVPV